ncbi:chromosome partitioning protein ParB [Candidatus Falkowbacteria bacterium CG10_big_fil_rev_8_21_14_0_10_37_6]|uniref:Chromosome partitioning protein ParB n=1 Tax=Candidatus Falkowbacteria bacterium CG10_big_fil_rev_8_21_14_0_10_37_6 TaxID=1974563 RepID=A0A2H0V6K3_9BACT|nr:MAG: chromosome partitioning protein ParB [Candidatus Falkowbacteria bacterium CG10_big_fil_rev_8_21_14_0_10_37_6]
MMKNSSSLGRGLSSLIPQKGNEQDAAELKDKNFFAGDKTSGLNAGQFEEASDNVVLRHVSVDSIEPNPHQPRTYFSDEALAELVDSVKEHGVLQPVIVSEAGNGLYQIIMGERRWRAAQQAGLKEMPVIVREASDMDKLELALVENIVREDLNPIELGLAYKKYIDEFGLTHEAAAKRLGKSRPAISNTIRLLQLPAEIQEAIAKGELSDAHAKVIVGLPTSEQQIACFHQVVGRKLTVARTRVAIQKMGGTKEARQTVDARDEEMEKKLRQYLGTRVSIQRTGYRGKILVEFFNYDEMVDIVDKIIGESEV